MVLVQTVLPVLTKTNHRYCRSHNPTLNQHLPIKEELSRYQVDMLTKVPV